MSSNYTELFQFHSVGMAEDLFHVIRFRGTEGLNALFEFSIDLVSRTVDVDTAAVLRNRGVFTIRRKDGSTAVFGGYPSAVTQSGHFNGYTYYSVVLRPAFYKLQGVVQSRIFLGKTVQDVVTELLQEQAFFTFSHEFRLSQAGYPAPEFAMQYEESVYNYICWRLEEQGITWHIEQDGDSDKLIFSDTPRIYSALPATPPLRYSPPSGMQVNRDEELIIAFNLSCRPLPKQVVIRTYNWQNPNKPVVGKAPVSAEGLGDVYHATEAVNNDAEASRIAAIRAEELQCRGRIFSGVSAVPTMRPGYLFTLTEHYNPSFNQQYFLTEVIHEGSQEAFLSLGLGIPLHNAKEHFFYHNNFTCIESDIQYRPARTASRAVINGIVQAFIDGSGSGSRPELDDFGRYKVLFPFDVSSRSKGNASSWIRMAQPQVGNKSGMSFPLLPGTEVTIAFQDGNPDLPVITGALANGETGSLTCGANTNVTGLRTAGGNQLVFNDKDTKQGVLLGTPSGRGLSMSSGSMDATAMTTDTWLRAASTMSADISTLGHTLSSGYKNSIVACNHDGATTTAAAFSCLSGLAGTLFDTFAKEPGSTESTYGADLAKLVSMAVQAGVNYEIQATALEQASKSVAYAAITMETKGKTVSQIQVTPKDGYLVAGIVLSLLGKVAQFGVESANVVVSQEDALKYDESHKAAAVHKVLSSSASALIPEILSSVLIYKALTNTQKEVKGGVSLHATQNNISLAAKGPVGMHTPHGILLNTAHCAAEKIVTTKIKKLVQEGGAKAVFMKKATAASDWGTHDTADEARKALNSYMKGCAELEIENDTARSYVATFTKLLLEQAEYRKSVIDKVSSQQAKTHHLMTSNAESILSMRTDKKGDVDPGISLLTKLKNANDASAIIQSVQVDENTTSRLSSLSKDGVLLCAKDGAKSSSILCKDGDITLTAADGGEATITLGKNGITLTFKGKEGIKLDDGAVEIAKGGKVQVGGLIINNNTIDSTVNGKIVLGKELEILGTSGAKTLGDLKTQLNDQKKAVDKVNAQANALACGLFMALCKIEQSAKKVQDDMD